MNSGQGFDRLAKSFERHLKAENKAPRTVQTYGEAVAQLVAFLQEIGVTDARLMEKQHIETFMVRLLHRCSAATAHNRYRALQQLTKWLTAEGFIPADPMIGMRPPMVPEQPLPLVSEADLRALLKTCTGRSFNDRRDDAMIRILVDSGLRRAELLDSPRV